MSTDESMGGEEGKPLLKVLDFNKEEEAKNSTPTTATTSAASRPDASTPPRPPSSSPSEVQTSETKWWQNYIPSISTPWSFNRSVSTPSGEVVKGTTIASYIRLPCTVLVSVHHTPL